MKDGNQIQEDAQRAVDFLKDTDIAHAEARANLSALQELRKTAKSFAFNAAEGAVGAREAIAYTDDDYLAHIEKIRVAEIEFHTLHNKRKRAELTVELYRTFSANTRRGNI